MSTLPDLPDETEPSDPRPTAGNPAERRDGLLAQARRQVSSPSEAADGHDQVAVCRDDLGCVVIALGARPDADVLTRLRALVPRDQRSSLGELVVDLTYVQEPPPGLGAVLSTLRQRCLEQGTVLMLSGVPPTVQREVDLASSHPGDEVSTNLPDPDGAG